MPRRGEVWLVDLGMAQKTRPGLILGGHSEFGLVTLAFFPFMTAIIALIVLVVDNCSHHYLHWSLR